MWSFSYLDAVTAVKHSRIRKSDIGTWADVKGPVNNVVVLPPPEVLRRSISRGLFIAQRLRLRIFITKLDSPTI